jgi:hypothetical protein
MAEEADFFGEHETADENTPEFLRTRIANYVKEMRGLQVQLEDLNYEASKLKAAIGELELKKIPDALLEAGLSEITTMDGLKVSTKLFVGAIPAEKKAEAFSWMDQHGHSSIIKRQVSVQFDKGSTEAAKKAEEAIRELGLEPKSTMDVHYQTFASFAKEQLNKGKALPLDAWGVYYGQKATIKG